jgi:hypothetical protein
MPNWKKIIVSGSDATLNSLNVATNVVAQSFTGSLFGTASYAANADFLDGRDSTVFATTASNQFNGNQTITGSLTVITGSAIELQVTNLGVNIGNAATDIHNVTGSFNINGSLAISSSLFTYQQNPSVVTGSFQTIASVATGSYRCAFFDYVAFNGPIVRAGTLVSTWSGSVTEFYENYTADLGGNTSIVILQTAISGSNIQLQAGISGSAWSVRSLVRLL